MASLKNAGYTLCDDAALADVAIVNTCGFIESAKAESIEEILELVTPEKGGPHQENRSDRMSFPALSGADSQGDSRGGRGGGHRRQRGNRGDHRASDGRGKRRKSSPIKKKCPCAATGSSPPPAIFAYLKIAEGCDNRCTYCAIPLIRGGYRSRQHGEHCGGSGKAGCGGAKELIVIAQDTSRYGLDLYGELKLPELLRRLCAVDGVRWIRLLYCYPDTITDELLDVMAREEKIVKYIDLPLQHASGRVLRAMNRRGGSGIPDPAHRPYAGEDSGPDSAHHLDLPASPGRPRRILRSCPQFVQDVRFDRLGCFAYSRRRALPLPNCRIRWKRT